MKKKKTTSAYLTFSDFVLYVQEQADIVNDPVYGKDALIEHSSYSLGSKKTVSSLPVTTHAASKPAATPSAYDGQMQRMCCLCDRNHKLYHCFQFKDMSIDKRRVFAKYNKLCTTCLSKGHTDSVCKSPHICKIDNCNKKHSSVLHMSDIRSTYDRHIPIVCSMCNENPKLFYCPKFAEMSVAAHIEYVADNRLCNNCLIAGHTAQFFICRVNGCNRNHSRLLHVDNTVSNHTASVNVDCHDMTNNNANVLCLLFQ